MIINPDFSAYFTHSMRIKQHEIEFRDRLNDELPANIIDAHVHASRPEDFDIVKAQGIMDKSASTYPETTIEQSHQIDSLLHPHKNVRKLRFSHAFAGIDHTAVNAYLLEQSPTEDRVALFGISESDEEVEYTREELRSGKYFGLKMYYCSGAVEKKNLYEYFPREVLEVAQKVEVPIILHLPKTVSRSLGELNTLAADYPHLRVMLAHVGVTWAYPDDFKLTMAEVASHANIFVDTSGVTDALIIQTALEQLGSDRVLYGSDEPLNLLREHTYVNPDLGPRLLTDYPYHWVDPLEYREYGYLLPKDVMYCELQQVGALTTAIRGLALSAKQRDAVTQAVFHDNAMREFNF